LLTGAFTKASICLWKIILAALIPPDTVTISLNKMKRFTVTEATEYITILVTIFFFIAVLILEFGTFKSTLIVLSVIPLGIVGALLALWFTGTPLSFVATVGLIALAGIEVKNTILLVDFTNQLRAEGMPMEQAIREAGEVRFLPIILTTLTAIGGLIPIAISTNPLISPLAIVMIGGLISSTLLSRIVTPVVYKLIPPRI
jgi:multidrug efflux pump subunit AcrB